MFRQIKLAEFYTDMQYLPLYVHFLELRTHKDKKKKSDILLSEDSVLPPVRTAANDCPWGIHSRREACDWINRPGEYAAVWMCASVGYVCIFCP